jgi:hypothetical protein
MTHTPGPFEIMELATPLKDWTGGRFIIEAPSAPGGLAVTIGGLGEEERANANLFKAAPKLLLACELMFQVIDRERWYTPRQREEIKAAINEARAA